MATVAVVLVGCTPTSTPTGSDTTTASASSSGTPSKDVVISGGTVIDTLDPIVFKTNADYMVLNSVYGTLVKENYKEVNGVMVGDNTYSMELADSLTWNTAGTLLTIKLKPNLEFQDGTPLTADDVVYTLQRSLSDAGYTSVFKTYIGVADPQKAIKVVDSTTVTMATAFKAPLMEKFLSFETFGILSSAAGKKAATTDDPWSMKFFNKNIISSGPYEVDSWADDGSNIVLKKNPNFTVEDITNSPPTVTVTNIADPSQAYLALQQGSIDLALGLSPKLAKQAQSEDSLKVSNSPAGDIVYFGFNNADPALKDVKVRQAIAYLLPYSALRDQVMQGFANSAYGPVPYPMDTAIDTAGTKDEYPTDVAKAKQLLSEAGASDLTITLSVDVSDAAAIQSATFIQSALAEGGVTVKVDQLQSADYNDKLGKHQLQTFIGEWYSWGEDPIYQMFFLLSKGAFTNYTGYDNAQFDDLITKGITEADTTTRASLSQQAQQLAIDDVPFVGLYTRNFLVVANKNVSGITQPDDELPFFQYLSVQ